VVKFRAVLKADPDGPGTYFMVPKELNERLGLRGRPKVNAVIAGQPYRGSLMPMGDGTFCLGVLKAIQQTAGVKQGDTIDVRLELDTALRVVEPPRGLADLLARDGKAAASWERLSFTNKKELAQSIIEAKKPETRERRLASAIEKLRSEKNA
jgi:hypothetical protein